MIPHSTMKNMTCITDTADVKQAHVTSNTGPQSMLRMIVLCYCSERRCRSSCDLRQVSCLSSMICQWTLWPPAPLGTLGTWTFIVRQNPHITGLPTDDLLAWRSVATVNTHTVRVQLLVVVLLCNDLGQVIFMLVPCLLCQSHLRVTTCDRQCPTSVVYRFLYFHAG